MTVSDFDAELAAYKHAAETAEPITAETLLKAEAGKKRPRPSLSLVPPLPSAKVPVAPKHPPKSVIQGVHPGAKSKSKGQGKIATPIAQASPAKPKYNEDSMADMKATKTRRGDASLGEGVPASPKDASPQSPRSQSPDIIREFEMPATPSVHSSAVTPIDHQSPPPPPPPEDEPAAVVETKSPFSPKALDTKFV